MRTSLALGGALLPLSASTQGNSVPILGRMLIALFFVLALLLIAALFRRRRSRVANDPAIVKAREHAQKVIDHLNQVVQKFQFVEGTNSLFNRLDAVLTQLGVADRETAELQAEAQRKQLFDLLTEYTSLAQGRTSKTGALLLHADAAPHYTHDTYMALAREALDLSQRISDALATEKLTAFCDTIERAIAQNLTRIDESDTQADNLAAALKALHEKGYSVATARLRRQITTARARIAQAELMNMQQNHLSAHEHLEAADVILRKVRTATDELPQRRQILVGQIADFEARIRGAAEALQPAKDLLARLRRRYDAETLAPISQEMATARLALRGLTQQLAKLNEHVDKYEIDEAEQTAAALEASLHSITQMHSRVQAHHDTLVQMNEEFLIRAAVVSTEVANLASRIAERQGNQRRHATSANTLRESIKTARTLAQSNPAAALRKIEAINTAAGKLEVRSAATHEEITKQ